MHQLAPALIAKCLARSEPAFEAVPLVAEEIEDYHALGLLVPGTGIEPACLAPKKSKYPYII